MATAPAGWYADPNDASQLRYWDGSVWTDHFAPAQQPDVLAPAPAPAVAPDPSPIVATATAERDVLIPSAVLEKPKGGLFGGKKALEEENTELRSALASLGATEREQIRADIARLLVERDQLVARSAAERQQAEGELVELRAEVIEVRELVMLQEVGIYEYRHPLDSSLDYKDQLSGLQGRIKLMAREGMAVHGATNWTVNGSEKEGTRMVRDFSKLMLRAYNNEADNAVRSMKPYALDSAVGRLDKARQTISKLGKTMSIEVTEQYHRARVEELELTADYVAKVAEEKERNRDERARLREDEQARREYEREKARLEKEAAHYASALAALQAKGDHAGAADTEAKLAEIQAAIEGVDQRSANTRAGYVYIISNIGAFGERMVKIGMTRRLEPMDRVRELGDASVPFRYDVHALVFSDDAVGLEGNLHEALSHKRVNIVNRHREFFYVTPVEVREVLTQFQGNLLSFEEFPEALEWRQSENMRGDGQPTDPSS